MKPLCVDCAPLKQKLLRLKLSLVQVAQSLLMQNLLKQRKDSLEIYKQQNRADLAQKEQEEITLIEKFLPKQMSEAELKDALTKIIEETGASSPADMGKVMGVATKQLAGKADGKTISVTVKELLSNKSKT